MSGRDDWQPGDLAWFVGHRKDCPTCIGEVIGCPDPAPGSAVRAIEYLAWAKDTCGLFFEGIAPSLCSCGFVKVTPEAADEFDRETIALEQRKPVEEVQP